VGRFRQHQHWRRRHRGVPALDRGEQVIEVCQIRNIALHTPDIFTDRIHGGVQFSLATTRDEDIGTLSDKLLSSGKTDTAVTASDKRDLSF
jgi:hypothetical protein